MLPASIISTRLSYFYVIPPTSKSLDSSPVSLMYQRGGVLNVTAMCATRVSHMDVRRAACGRACLGLTRVQLQDVVVHAHGTMGIDLSDSPSSFVTNSRYGGLYRHTCHRW